MRFFIGVTDYDWFRLHASKPVVEEVNFWKPSPEVTFGIPRTPTGALRPALRRLPV
jgi:hypothetical protein